MNCLLNALAMSFGLMCVLSSSSSSLAIENNYNYMPSCLILIYLLYLFPLFLFIQTQIYSELHAHVKTRVLIC